MFPWTVPKPTPDQLKRVTFPFDVLKQDNFTMPPEGWNGTDPTWSAWEVNGAPAWVNYQDLTINHLDDNHTWPANAALFELNSDPNSDEPTWAYMVIDGGHQDEEEKPPGESIIPAAHPVSLSSRVVTLSLGLRPYALQTNWANEIDVTLDASAWP